MVRVESTLDGLYLVIDREKRQKAERYEAALKNGRSLKEKFWNAAQTLFCTDLSQAELMDFYESEMSSCDDNGMDVITMDERKLMEEEYCHSYSVKKMLRNMPSTIAPKFGMI